MMSKTFFYGIILTYFFSGVLLANEGNAQHKSVNEVFISLKLQQVTVRRALESIQENTEFKFIFEQGVLSATEGQRVTLMVDNESVADVLKTVSNETDLSFRQLNGSIVVKAPPPLKKLQTPKEEESALEQNISGKVTDENGEPLPGASVLVKNTSIGVITDAVGNYRLSAPDEATTLVFSYVGYERKEVAIAGRAVIDISLKFDVTTLGEVIVSTGYWETPERLNPGNIARITSEEIEKQPVTNPLQALQGRIAGVFIQQNTGVPGGNFNIQIRGQNSLRSDGNNPLYIVNGVPFTSTALGSEVGGTIVGGGNPLSSLNPQDIESIEILKDADATAIYGSRGANGVVLITTKKGTAGKTEVDINVYSGAGKVSNKMDLLNTAQYLEMRNEAFSNDGLTPGSIFPDNDLLLWDTTRFTDWQDVLIGGTANVTNAQATISGGSTTTRFLLGSGYYKETTVFPGDFDYQKYSTNFNLNHASVNGKFNVDFSGNYVIENNNLLRSDLTFTALTLPPLAPAIYDEEGNLNWEEGTWDNPFASLQRKFESRTNSLIGNAVVSYQIMEGLQIKANLGYTELLIKENRTSPSTSLNPFLGLEASSDFGQNSIKTWIIEPQIHYKTTIGNHGTLSFLVGSTFQKNKGENQVLFTSGYSSDALLNDIQAATDISVQAANSTEYRYNAIFGRINYDYKGKFILNLTGRRDGSSRFGPEEQFANFGAVGAGWIFTNEEFVKNNLSFLSFGKVRASYGSTGSDQIGDYEFLELWSSTQFSYDGIQGLIPQNLFNPEYAWERNRKLEAAIELGVLDDRIQISTSYFRNRSSNQLVGIPLANTTGFPSIQSNFPAEVENKGVELEINTVNVKTNNFNWTTSFNITIPQNELISYPDIQNSAFRLQYEVGKSLFVQKRYHFLGVDTELGISTYEDVNTDDNFIPDDDFQALKEVTQDYYGGIVNSFSYKGFQLDIFFQFVKQTGWDYLATFLDLPGTASNQPVLVMDRWQNPGDETNIQKFSQTFGDPFFAHVLGSQSDNLFGDASFIRLKNVSLSYQFPSALTDKIKLKNLRIYLQGQNLLTITDFNGLDPETQFPTLPPIRMFTGGLQITL